MPTLFLAKSEPKSYSINTFEKDGKTLWDGVHNFQAINAIKQWRIGDLVLIYHSVSDKAIVGLARVVGQPFENLDDPRKSWAAELRFVCKFKANEIVTLAEIKSTGKFENFVLVRNSRLSVMECPSDFVAWIKIRIPKIDGYLDDK